MSSKSEHFNILSQANSFLKSRNISPIIETSLNFRKNDTSLSLKYSSYLIRNEDIDNVAPSVEQLNKLLFHTIYNSDGPFNIVDFALQFMNKNNSSTQNCKSFSKWIELKLSLTSDQIEKRFKDLIESTSASSSSSHSTTDEPLESFYFQKWIKRQPLSTPFDSDILALRSMETFILLSILNFNFSEKNKESPDSDSYNKLEEQLVDWSEGIGLIRSISHHTIHHSLDNSMDIDFNPSADHSISSTSTSSGPNLKHNEFEIYLLEKFKTFNRIKEIVEIVSERCGIPIDSDVEDEKSSLSIINNNNENRNEKIDTFISKQKLDDFKSKSKDHPKHWRRVKPVTLPIKRVTTSSVARSSSLSLNELKSNRFLSTSSRQVDLDLISKPSIDQMSFSRRHSEASAPSPHIIQHKTPTKTHKYSKFISSTTSTENNSNSILSDSFVILETPPRPKTTLQIHQNDLTSTVRRLFPQNSTEK